MRLAFVQREAKPERDLAAAAGTRRRSEPATAAPHSVGRIATLQQTLGNQALQRLLQRKPLVSEPGDPLEREADRIAEQVTAGLGGRTALPEGATRSGASPPLLSVGSHRLLDGGSPDAGAAPPTLGGGAATGAGHPAVSGTTSAGGASPVAAPTLPVAAFSRFVTAGKPACCRLPDCPAHLGVANAGDATARNGMNLFFTISGHRPTVWYGFVQAVHSKLCALSGGHWTKLDEKGPGAQDSPPVGATCLTPDAHGEIAMTDAPGLRYKPGSPVTEPYQELAFVMNATDWVIAREPPGPWKAISHLFYWHSTTRLLLSGTFQLTTAGNEIVRGLTKIGDCPP